MGILVVWNVSPQIEKYEVGLFSSHVFWAKGCCRPTLKKIKKCGEARNELGPMSMWRKATQNKQRHTHSKLCVVYVSSMSCLCVFARPPSPFLWRLKKELFLFFSRRLDGQLPTQWPTVPNGFGWDDGPTTFHPFATLGLEKWNKRKASTNKTPS